MPVGIASIASVLLKVVRHRDDIAKIADAIQTVRELIPELRPDQPAPAPPSVATEEPPPPPMPEGLSTTWLQESLNTLINAGLEVDGDYGDVTRAAVKEYQRQHGLTVDGWAGVDTMSSIWEELHK